MLIKIPLHDSWRLRASGGEVPDALRTRAFEVSVPIDVLTALQRAGAIEDPWDGDNEYSLQWLGMTDWEFTRQLPELPTSGRVDLVMHGLDTIATVRVGGEVLARSRNMHRTYRVELPETARHGAVLSILLDAPVPNATNERDRLGARPSAFSDIAPFLRKKACDFGWDWGPALTGSGIWRDVVVEAWSTARIAAVRPTVSVTSGVGHVALDIEIERAASDNDTVLSVCVQLGATRTRIPVPSGVSRVSGTISIAEPNLWWPAGLGQQTLYDLHTTLIQGGVLLDALTKRIGFRTLTVDQEVDGAGVSFGITVNGHRMFVRGFNWIPAHTSISAVTSADYRARIMDAVNLGANLLRVWGGGVFESDAFYDACDEAGILVWQDFLFACAAYPEAPPMTEEVHAEARDNITRLMPHPSLALWNGNNENLWFWHLHRWNEILDGKSWGENFYFHVLPSAVADLDPGRTYIPGSPSSGDRWHDPNDPTRGVVHLWLAGDFRAYDDHRPRFVSEFGFQGPPTRPTFDAVVHDRDPSPFSPGTVQLQKALGGTQRINEVLDIHFGVPLDFDEWYWCSQLVQARAVRYGIERFRSDEPYCRGTIVWQLNDCWPALSWSVIDVEGRWKPAAYAVRSAFRDRIVVLRIVDGAPSLFICNSTSEPWRASVEVSRWDGAREVWRGKVDYVVEAHRSDRAPLGPASAPMKETELLVATVDDSRAVVLGGTDREYPDAEPEYGVDVARESNGVAVKIAAATILRDILIGVESIDPDAHADINLVTLLPGEFATWHVMTEHPYAFTEASVRAAVRTARAASWRDADFRGLGALDET